MSPQPVFSRPATPVIALAAALLAAACTARPVAMEVSHAVAHSSGEKLVRFRSKDELRRYLTPEERVSLPAEAGVPGGAATDEEVVMDTPGATGDVAQDAPPPVEALGETIVVTGSVIERSGLSTAAPITDRSNAATITNTQEVGVDEGGIVKAEGDYLIVLRRGRLFSVRLGDGTMTPVSVVDVAPPGAPPGTWYDEMLVSGDTIVVVGYSYGAGGTELLLFDLDPKTGAIGHRSSFVLRSNDYYSSRNYASRLLGDELVFYMPFLLARGGDEDGDALLPGLRPCCSPDARWTTIIDQTEIYRPIQQTDAPVLHTVMTCDLGGTELDCRARGVIGPYGRTFYVSPTAVYVWVSGGHSAGLERRGIAEAPAVVYRLPLGTDDPVGALHVWGNPIDQFSFKEGDDGYLNVLVRAEGGGDAMWSPEVGGGELALLRLPVAGFSTRVGTARPAAYSALPGPAAGWTMQNRFVGDHVLYGAGSGWDMPDPERDDLVYAYPYRTGGVADLVVLGHGIDRIEQMGSGAVVIGTDGRDLHFSSLSLEHRPRLVARHVQRSASQGELRSHGFFFKPDGDGDEDDGVLGLPVRGEARPGHEHLIHGSASVLFLRVDDLSLHRLGALAARPEVADDRCSVSCVDWYGNARPIFYRNRIFALLGYELVEGRIGWRGMREVGRIDMFAHFRPLRTR